MSIQIFLQGKLLGVADFLRAPGADADDAFLGRAQYLSLLSETLPRALLAELGLAQILLGSSGGGQFLVVLPEESRDGAEVFLQNASEEILRISGQTLHLVWAVTENLGDWSDVRKRLGDKVQRSRSIERGVDAAFFASAPAPEAPADAAFKELQAANSAGWSPDSPGQVVTENAKHSWALSGSVDALPMARHTAPTDDVQRAATPAELGSRATGQATWGVLRGDVDNFGIRLRRATSIEEHIRLSVMYKQFFAGELEVQCSQPEFWRKVTVLYSGGDDFAVFGAWDSLILLAAELRRLFVRFAEANLAEFPGAEGKTLTMALALADSPDAHLSDVYEEAGRRLEFAKSEDKDCVWLLGRTLEWKQYGDASSLRDSLTKMVTEWGCPPSSLRDLCSIYRESQARMSRRQARKVGERPWRYHRRIQRVLSPVRESREREFQKARTALIADLIGRSGGYLKLRPSGRVALEWARLSTEV